MNQRTKDEWGILINGLCIGFTFGWLFGVLIVRLSLS
jgi:hypothetical protein